MTLYVKDGKYHFDDALLAYVRKGSVAVLKAFLQNDNPDATDSLGETLLHSAAESNNVPMAQHFIDNKYDIDVINDHGDTPLMLAVRHGSVDTAILLIKAGAEIYHRDYQDKSLLPERRHYKFLANMLDKTRRKLNFSDWLEKYRELVKCILERVRKDCWNDEQLLISRLTDMGCSLINVICLRDANVTKLMLENGYSVEEREDETRRTVLHEAVELSDFENVKVLIEHGADIGAEDENNLTPMYSSIDKVEDMKILKILIEHGALLTPSHKGHCTASEFILQNGRLWAIKTAIQYKDFEWDAQDSLFTLVFNSDPDTLEVVRGKSLDVNAIDTSHKSTLLSFAAGVGKLTKVQFLLESGADPNIVGEFDHTSLTSAFICPLMQKNNYLPIIRLMLQYGANAQYSYPDGRTVFDVVMQDFDILLEPVVAHLAMIESLGETITEVIRGKINAHNYFKNYFRTCKQQLERMKNRILWEGVTIYQLLTENQPKITRYARNHEFADKLKNIKLERSMKSYYSICIRKKVGKAIDIIALRKEAAAAMKKFVTHRVKNYHDILSEIVEYLDNYDLKNICKVASLEELDSFNLNTLFA